MADRRVTYTLALGSDPQAKKEAAEMAALFRSVESAAKAASKAVNEARGATDRARSSAGGPMASRGGSGPSSFARGMSAGARNLADERREREGILREKLRAIQTEERAASRAAAAITRANREMLSGLRQTAVGVGSVARAFVLLGVSGEENLTRALQVLAKFEAGMQGISGITNILAGAGKVFSASRSGGLGAGIGALGLPSTVLAGAGALGLGAGAGFGIGRLAIGGDSFGRMTDAFGITNYSGERAAASRQRLAGIADRQSAARNRLDQRYGDINTLAGFDLDDARSRGIGFASEQARANVAAARARSASLEARINTGTAGSAETISRERQLAQEGQVNALRAAIGIERERLSIVQQAVAAERDKTRAVMEGIRAGTANIGLADTQTLRTAEAGARARREGRQLTPEQASALGLVSPEVSQEEAFKIGQSRLSQFPELKALLDGLVAAEKARSQAVQVKIAQEVSGSIRVTTDIAKLEADIKAVIKSLEGSLSQAVRRELEAAIADRTSQETLRRATQGI